MKTKDRNHSEMSSNSVSNPILLQSKSPIKSQSINKIGQSFANEESTNNQVHQKSIENDPSQQKCAK